MSARLAPYGSEEHAHNLLKLGIDKGKTPQSLVARMPSPEIAAKVGLPPDIGCGVKTYRVIRHNAHS